MFDDLRQAVRNIEFLADPKVGEVRVIATDPIIVGALPPVLDRLRQKHREISVQVMPIATFTQQCRDLRERKFDLFLGRITLPVDEDINLEVLFRDRMTIVAGPKSPWARRQKVKLSDLADEPWILPWPDTQVGGVIADAFRAKGCEISAEGRDLGSSLPDVRSTAERKLFRHSSGFHVCSSASTCQGSRCWPWTCPLSPGRSKS